MKIKRHQRESVHCNRFNPCVNQGPAMATIVVNVFCDGDNSDIRLRQLSALSVVCLMSFSKKGWLLLIVPCGLLVWLHGERLTACYHVTVFQDDQEVLFLITLISIISVCSLVISSVDFALLCFLFWKEPAGWQCWQWKLPTFILLCFRHGICLLFTFSTLCLEPKISLL